MRSDAGNVFSAMSISDCMYESLPKAQTPFLKNPYDAIALLSHACMVVVGFRLVGLGEDHSIEVKDLSGPNEPQMLPLEWNSSTSNDYAFRYAHDQSSLQYLIKISRLGNKAVINGLGIGDDRVHTMDLLVKDFISEGSLPYTPTSEQGPNEGKLALRQVFISAGRLTDASSMLKLQIIQKLAPGLRKEGYEESAHSASPNSSTREQRTQQQRPEPGRNPDEPATHDPSPNDRLPPAARPRPFHDPLAAEPPRPFPAGDFPPPGFEDEYEMNGRRGDLRDGRRPLNIGERDLYPPGIGPHDPLRGGGFGPGGGGMHPTFDDPLFDGRQGGGTGGPNGQVPPGARYDPIGPGDARDLRGGPRFPGGGGGFGNPRNPFGGFGGSDFI